MFFISFFFFFLMNPLPPESTRPYTLFPYTTLCRSPCAPIDRLVAALRVHDYYKDAEVIFRGKITGLERDTSKGWVFGNCTVSAMTGSEQAELKFQNENLIVTVDGRLRCIVPDLVTIVDAETAHAIPTERLAYGRSEEHPSEL